jgi:serpin B
VSTLKPALRSATRSASRPCAGPCCLILLLGFALGACSRGESRPDPERRAAPSSVASVAPTPPAPASSAKPDDDSSELAPPSRDASSCPREGAAALPDLDPEIARASPRAGAERRAIADLAAFAWDFYGRAAVGERNFVYSPYSIAVASAMLSAAAGGKTLAEIQNALRFSHTGAKLHEAHNALSSVLSSRNHPGTKQHDVQLLRVSNHLWVDSSARPTPAFLDTLARHYGSAAHVVEFAEHADEVRRAINHRVCRDTRALIPELLASGSVDSDTRLVMTNALYLKALWKKQFAKEETEARSFSTLSGGVVDAPTMHGQREGRYAAGKGYLVASLPYSGAELELVFLVPDKGNFPSFVRSLDAAKVAATTAGLRPKLLEISLPRFKIQSSLPLEQALARAGMKAAFGRAAEFPQVGAHVYVGKAVHEARLVLDEEGTEAAAATAFGMKWTSSGPDVTPVVVQIDRPFVFFIRDQSGAVLFLGHVLDPR